MSTRTCPLPDNWEEYNLEPIPSVGLLTTQQLCFIIAASSSGLTILISGFLVMRHLRRYTDPIQQRQVIRIIFVPVVFSLLSALSILNYHATEYLKPFIHLYETFALAALFILFVDYVAPGSRTRLTYFDMLERRKYKRMLRPSKGYKVLSGGCRRWFKEKWLAVFLYLIVDIIMTTVELCTKALGAYCETSWRPRFAHVWVTIIPTIFLIWAFFRGVMLYYVRMKSEPEFARHRPGLKLVAFKLIVFINLIQGFVFEALDIETSHKLTGYDLKYGIPAALVAVEQICFAVFFLYAYGSREYHENTKQVDRRRMGILRAAVHAFNPADLFVGIFTAFKYLFGGGSDNAKNGIQYDGSNPHLELMAYQSAPIRPSNPY